MTHSRWYTTFIVLALVVGCDQAKQDVQQAAEKAAAEATAKVKQAEQEAKVAVERAGEKAKSEVESAAANVASLKVGDIDLGKDLASLMEGLKGTLGEVKDVPTAQAALPKLEEANLGLDKLLGLVDQLPAAAKPALANMIKTHAATITETVKKVVGIEGVGAILKPVLDQIVAKLNAVSGDGAPLSK